MSNNIDFRNELLDLKSFFQAGLNKCLKLEEMLGAVSTASSKNKNNKLFEAAEIITAKRIAKITKKAKKRSDG